MDPLNFGVGDSEPDAPTPLSTDTEESLVNGFLKDIPEQDRPIVEKYAKTWDGNVTRKFQEIHNQYAPYKELGEVDNIKAAVQFANYVNSDPTQAYKAMEAALRETYGDDFDEVMGQEIEKVKQEMTDDQDYELEEEDPGSAEYERVHQLENKLQEFEERFTQQDLREQEEQELAQFDNYMESLHTEHGEFDDAWVTSRIASGMDPVQAVKAYNSFVEDLISSRVNKPTPPPILGGQGGVPNDQADVSTLKGPDRKALVANLLNAAKG